MVQKAVAGQRLGRCRWPRWQRSTAVNQLAVVLFVGMGAGCGKLADEGKLPNNVPDPGSQHTPAGAMLRYGHVVSLALPQAFEFFAAKTGILTDELANLPAPSRVNGKYTKIDSRVELATDFEDEYKRLNYVRGQAREARGFVAAYAPDSSPALAGHLYAIEGYAELLLADLFCSGIPLSTVDFGADYTLAPGSTTADVYRHAIVFFDSALALTGDSMRLQHFAALGKGRALLALGRYAEAAGAVAGVPDLYKYQAAYLYPRPFNDPQRDFDNHVVNWGGNYPHRSLLYALRDPDDSTYYQVVAAPPSVGDNEGINGLNYRSSNDPRTPAEPLAGTDLNGHTLYWPANYNKNTLTLASGIEARLIEAEAALWANAADGQWLAKLNYLRQTIPVPPLLMDCATNPITLVVTCTPKPVPPAEPLSDLTDPGTDGSGSDALRVDLLFRERAFWLYLTGHRQGDLRRLVREYGRMPETVYPTGGYPGGDGEYGTGIVAPVPASEQQLNQRYTGCFHQGA